MGRHEKPTKVVRPAGPRLRSGRTIVRESESKRRVGMAYEARAVTLN